MAIAQRRSSRLCTHMSRLAPRATGAMEPRMTRPKPMATSTGADLTYVACMCQVQHAAANHPACTMPWHGAHLLEDWLVRADLSAKGCQHAEHGCAAVDGLWQQA